MQKRECKKEGAGAKPPLKKSEGARPHFPTPVLLLSDDTEIDHLTCEMRWIGRRMAGIEAWRLAKWNRKLTPQIDYSIHIEKNGICSRCVCVTGSCSVRMSSPHFIRHSITLGHVKWLHVTWTEVNLTWSWNWNRERKCADTIGTVLVSWAGQFQC